MGNILSTPRRRTALSVTISSLLSLATAPAFAAFPAPPSAPCEGVGNCADDGFRYSDGSFVTQEVSEYADGSGERVQNYMSVGPDGVRVNSMGDGVLYTYITGTDEYGNPIVEYASSYASAPVVLDTGKTINMAAASAIQGGARIMNLADGIDGMDAVNKRQLDAAMQNAGGNDPLAVKYTDSSRTAVSVGGRMANVHNGQNDLDAANMSQLRGVQNIAQDGVNRANNAQGRAEAAGAYAVDAYNHAETARNAAGTAQATANQGVSDAAAAQQRADYVAGQVFSLDSIAVKYQDLFKRAVQFGTPEAGPVLLGNVADGIADNDAVNVAQLRKVAGDLEGVAGDALMFNGVTYTANRAGSATRISGVADGVDAGDAVNKSQLDTVQSGVDDLSSVAVKYTDATRSAVVLGTPEAGAVRLGNVADGVDRLDAVNKSQLDTVRDELAGVAGDALLFDGTAYNAERSGTPTRITGVAAGVNATDATNFTQLSALTSALGAGAGWNNGGFSGPQYRIGSMDFGNVGDAFAAVDGKLAGLEGRVSDVEQSPAITRPVIYDDASKDALTLEGPGGTRISNLAAGINGTDAANLNQVRQGIGESRDYTDSKARETLTESKAYTDSRIADMWGGMDDLSRQVNMRFGELDRRIDRQSAMTSAMVQMATNAGGSRSEFGRVGAGIGWSGGQRALSVGWSKAIGRGSFSFGGAISGGESSAGIGFGIDL